MNASVAASALVTTPDGTTSFFVREPDATALEISLPATLLRSVETKTGANEGAIVVEGRAGTLRLPTSYLSSLAVEDEGAVIIATIQAVDEADATASIRTSAMNDQVELLSQAVSFTLSVRNSDGSVREVPDTGSTFVERTLSLGETILEPHQASVFMLTADGRLGYVPAVFERTEDGEYTARFFRSGFSTYVVGTRKIDFADMESHWAQETVRILAAKGVIRGRSEAAFEPDAAITRAEYAALLVQALGLHDKAQSAVYTDVTPASWFYTDVGIATEVGIVQGSHARFHPNDTVTREQLATMTLRALRFADASIAIREADLMSYEDHVNVSPWARETVGQAVEAGLIQGSGGQLRPLATATRGEAAALIHRLLQKLEFINE